MLFKLIECHFMVGTRILQYTFSLTKAVTFFRVTLLVFKFLTWSPIAYVVESLTLSRKTKNHHRKLTMVANGSTLIRCNERLGFN